MTLSKNQKNNIPTIELYGVYKFYPGAKKPAVSNVSLAVEDGEFLCLLGPSGCGKSTILRMIAGLENPTEGTICIKKQVVDDVAKAKHIPAEKRDLGVVFQNYALWPHMKVKDNIAFGPRIKKVPKKEVEQLVYSALRKLSITRYAERYPSELSGGQQQRVAIARTLAAQNKILLMDEPLSNLDARLRLQMRAEFQRIHKETETTIVFVTHDQWEAMTLATRIVVMNESSIQQIGSPMDIYEKPVNRFVAEFMGSPPLNVVELSGGGHLKLQLQAWFENHHLKGSSVGIRPEHLNFVNSNGEIPVNALNITVEISALLPTGGFWIIEAKSIMSNQYFFATSILPPTVNIGAIVTAWVEAKHLLVFDNEDNRILTDFDT